MGLLVEIVQLHEVRNDADRVADDLTDAAPEPGANNSTDAESCDDPDYRDAPSFRCAVSRAHVATKSRAKPCVRFGDVSVQRAPLRFGRRRLARRDVADL